MKPYDKLASLVSLLFFGARKKAKNQMQINLKISSTKNHFRVGWINSIHYHEALVHFKKILLFKESLQAKERERDRERERGR